MNTIVTLLLAANAAAAPAPAAKPDGAKIFAAKCTTCHGKDGKGSAAMAKMYKLKDPSILNLSVTKKTEAELVKTITNGEQKMPAFKGKLKDAEIAAVAGYVHGLGAAEAPKPAK